MISTGPVRLALVLIAIKWTGSMPTKEPTTRRPTQPQIGDTIKQLTNLLMTENNTSPDVLDTRTPPKVKQQMKKVAQKDNLENSHPGVAVPVEESDLLLEESTKKFNFYKVESKPTTERGISTWVLLNSQTVPAVTSTTKPPRKPALKQEGNGNATVSDVEILNRNVKPLFKKRPSTTTKKPTTLSERDSSPVADKLTKVKASVLTSAINNKTKTENIKKQNTTVTKKFPTTTERMQEILTIKPNNKTATTVSVKDNELIPLEAKDDEFDIITTTPASKKTRRPPTTKRKKNKKRRRPALEKSDTNSTKLSTKIAQKEKPISTQIYNYLSREIIPTVGVGLVGLMVTAGLASYFLYPFGAARRSYEIDRKDKESYYYNDEYAPGGIAEEDAIGKVIAGMPVSSNFHDYRSPSSRDAYSSLRYKQDHRKPQQTAVEAVYFPSKSYGDEDDLHHQNHKSDYYSQGNYNKEIYEQSHETGYMVDDKQFVVGNVPKDMQEVTPVIVPEHGPRKLPESTSKDVGQGLSEVVADYAPRNLPIIYEKAGARRVRTRRRRSSDLDNEISSKEEIVDKNKKKQKPTKPTLSTTPEPVDSDPTKSNTSPSFMNALSRYFLIQVKLGVDLIQAAAEAITRYFSDVQTRFSNNHEAMNKESPRRL